MELKIIDVSKHQRRIDWKQARNHIDGAIIRCGYGSDIKSQDDSQFVANVKGCLQNNIPFGVYLYSYAKTIEEAKSEAAHVLRLLEPYKDKLSFPVYYDLEEAGTESGAVERAIVFGDIIEAAGYWCGIYANQYWWRTYLKGGLDRFTKWVAKYSTEKPSGISGTYDIWQYSSKGSVPGISGYVDMNICYRDLPAEITGSATVDTNKYYPKYTGNTISIAKALNSLCIISTFEYRQKIAKANNIAGYKGTAAQNTYMLKLLKEGKLIKVQGTK